MEVFDTKCPVDPSKICLYRVRLARLAVDIVTPGTELQDATTVLSGRNVATDSLNTHYERVRAEGCDDTSSGLVLGSKLPTVETSREIPGLRVVRIIRRMGNK